MFFYLIQRISLTLVTLWLAFTLSFVALRLLPGDAITATLSRSGATADQIAARRSLLGLDQPLFTQYRQSLVGVLSGNLGTSLISDRPVSQMITEQFGATVLLSLSALVVAIIIGVSLSMAAVLSPARWIRNSTAVAISLLLSSPVYWTGTLLIYLFSVILRWLPSAGSGDWRSLILPSLALGLSMAGSIARITSGSLRDLRSADFIRTAYAKGLPAWLVVLRHLLRPALIPLIAVIGLQAGFLLGGTVVTETLFVRQGIGQVLISAIHDHDFPVVQGIVLLSAVAYSLISTTADLLIGLADPRVSAT